MISLQPPSTILECIENGKKTNPQSYLILNLCPLDIHPTSILNNSC